MKVLVAAYRDFFALSDDELGCTDVAQHKIDTGVQVTIKQYPRCTPFVHRERMVVDMDTKGVVSPSVSAWASPIVLVPT